MSDGSEFQVCGAATENARRAKRITHFIFSSQLLTTFTLALRCHDVKEVSGHE